ncbi:hypothetical protein [Arthrobacter sp. NPDC092385]|uniref:hypothetical protein n=1 Tax=Arthrobacter sp. NPDC092385 TaxID=3363943 RepID=UPI003816881C
MTPLKPLALASIVSLAVLVLGACATPGDPGSEPVPEPGVVGSADPLATGAPAATGEVIGQGTVLQAGTAPPQFCLGGVMESYPPQCSGPGIVNWDWEQADQWETASGVTWGAYALTGTWDGRDFTRTGAPIPLSLYDAMPFEDPLAGRQGTTDEQELERIQQDIVAGHDGYVLTAGAERGFATVTVVYDDGSFQARMDGEYGAGVVVVLSALRPTG